MGKFEWLFYVILAGLAWGTYVPIIFYGGNELGGKANARLLAILCVGLAYFVIGVLFPLVLFQFFARQFPWPEMRTTGLVFSSLAGVAGAVGAIFVVFATQAARTAAPANNPEAYRILIAPLIFGLAPVINTLVSTVWHPQGDRWFQFYLKAPHPLLWVGIFLVGAGAALVLYAKEISTHKGPANTPAVQKSLEAKAMSPASSES